MAKKVSILGSTGSIGTNTVKLLTSTHSDYQVNALTAANNVELLAEQARNLKAKMAVISNTALYNELKDKLFGTNIQVKAGEEGLLEAASDGNDLVVSALVGIAGLKPTMAAINAKTNIALANKECLVCAGRLMTLAASANNVKIIPVDSEHSAIFQVFETSNKEKIEKIILTASGGAFRDLTKEELPFVTKEQALNHPNWKMGPKVTIDSATLMNKALEVIEAYYLFEMPLEKIEVLIHRESIIHSMVAYIDGSVLAQLGVPDMRTPISYALSWPKREMVIMDRLNLAKIGSLNFAEADNEKYPALALARKVLALGESYPIVMNAANEVAVSAFLNDKIKFIDIIPLLEEAISKLALPAPNTIEEVMAIDQQARQVTNELLAK